MSVYQPSSRIPYICARCLRRQPRQRQYSSITSGNLPSPPPPSGAAHLTTRRLISLHGPEAPKFLNGIITNAINLSSRAGLYAAFLTAQGKVLNDVFVYPTLGSQWHSETNKDDDQGFLVEVDAEAAEILFKHVKRHKLRAKLKVRLLDEGELGVWAVWKDGERWTAHGQGGATDESTISLTDCRAPGMGSRVLVPGVSSGSGPVGNSPALEGVEEADLDAYTIRRFLRGVAEGQREIPREETLPMNANLDIMGGIDFKKGCYIGQELTIRTHHTGVVRRRILPIQLYDATAGAPEKLEYIPQAGLAVADVGLDMTRDGKKRATGKLIASVGNVGLGMCRLEQMSDLVVSGEPSTFSPEDMFLVQGAEGQELGIKAFVPDWMRGRIRGPKQQKRVE